MFRSQVTQNDSTSPLSKGLCCLSLVYAFDIVTSRKHSFHVINKSATDHPASAIPALFNDIELYAPTDRLGFTPGSVRLSIPN
jgi:hypothetical protein